MSTIESTTVSSRIPNNILKDIDNISKITQRNRSFHIKKALELYLADYADLQISLDRLQDSNDKTISLKEIRDKLNV